MEPLNFPTELIVPAEAHGARLDKFVSAQRSDLSRAFVQTLIGAGHIQVGGAARKPNYAVKTGESIVLNIPPPTKTALAAQDIALDLLYEDDALLVVNKPAGMVAHPAVGHPSGTLANAVLGHAPEIVTGNAERPGIAHRLDRDTSGIMLVAKTDAALRALQAQFAARRVHKTYLALAHGDVRTPEGKIDAPLGRDPHDRKKMAIVTCGRARDAITIFRVLARNAKYSLLQIEPETGRTHQIRVHLAFLKHPVVADAMYGKRKNDLGLTRQFLHAWRIAFAHPVTGEACAFQVAPPADLQNALRQAGFDAEQFLV